MSRFYPIRCGRSVPEQRYIRARLDLWKSLPRTEREDIRRRIREIARGGVERSALEAVLLRGMSPTTAAELYRVKKSRVYEMQRAFLEGFVLWES